MTSQVFYFEWFLNHRFGSYFADAAQRITISEGAAVGGDLYFEDARYGRPFTVWFAGEQVADTEEEAPRRMYLEAEERAVLRARFPVCVPAVTLPASEFVHMLTHTVARYRLAG